MIWLFLIPAAFLLLGIADLPIGYYTFLRIVVFISSCLVAMGSYAQGDKLNLGVILFAVIALLFNPFIPVYLHDKEAWSVIDSITGVIYVGVGIYAAIQDKKKENEHKRVDIQ